MGLYLGNKYQNLFSKKKTIIISCKLWIESRKRLGESEELGFCWHIIQPNSSQPLNCSVISNRQIRESVSRGGILWFVLFLVSLIVQTWTNWLSAEESRFMYIKKQNIKIKNRQFKLNKIKKTHPTNMLWCGEQVTITKH